MLGPAIFSPAKLFRRQLFASNHRLRVFINLRWAGADLWRGFDCLVALAPVAPNAPKFSWYFVKTPKSAPNLHIAALRYFLLLYFIMLTYPEEL